MADGDKFPLTMMKDGEKVVIGECEIIDGEVHAHVTDPEMAKKLGNFDYSDFSVPVETPEHHNIFDEKDKG